MPSADVAPMCTVRCPALTQHTGLPGMVTQKRVSFTEVAFPHAHTHPACDVRYRHRQLSSYAPGMQHPALTASNALPGPEKEPREHHHQHERPPQPQPAHFQEPSRYPPSRSLMHFAFLDAPSLPPGRSGTRRGSTSPAQHGDHHGHLHSSRPSSPVVSSRAPKARGRRQSLYIQHGAALTRRTGIDLAHQKGEGVQPDRRRSSYYQPSYLSAGVRQNPHGAGHNPLGIHPSLLGRTISEASDEGSPIRRRSNSEWHEDGNVSRRGSALCTCAASIPCICHATSGTDLGFAWTWTRECGAWSYGQVTSPVPFVLHLLYVLSRMSEFCRARPDTEAE